MTLEKAFKIDLNLTLKLSPLRRCAKYYFFLLSCLFLFYVKIKFQENEKYILNLFFFSGSCWIHSTIWRSNKISIYIKKYKKKKKCDTGLERCKTKTSREFEKKLFFFECYFNMYMQSDVYNKRSSIVCFFFSCFILFDFQNNIKHTHFKPLPFTLLCVRKQ